jgi:hypothetical protein
MSRDTQIPEWLASGTRPPATFRPSIPNMGPQTVSAAPVDVRSHMSWWDSRTLPALGVAVQSGVILSAYGTGCVRVPRLVAVAHTPREKESQDLTARGHRARERDFRVAHPEAFRPLAGQWVVLEGEEIVAHGHNASLVVAEARSRGIRVPYIFLVEDPEDDSVWIGL